MLLLLAYLVAAVSEEELCCPLDVGDGCRPVEVPHQVPRLLIVLGNLPTVQVWNGTPPVQPSRGTGLKWNISSTTFPRYRSEMEHVNLTFPRYRSEMKHLQYNLPGIQVWNGTPPVQPSRGTGLKWNNSSTTFPWYRSEMEQLQYSIPVVQVWNGTPPVQPSRGTGLKWNTSI